MMDVLRERSHFPLGSMAGNDVGSKGEASETQLRIQAPTTGAQNPPQKRGSN